jgi:Omp85 superfamily domain
MRIAITLFILFFAAQLSAQTTVETPQKDIRDVLKTLWKRGSSLRTDTITKKEKRVEFSVVPAFGYSLSTGWAGVVASNTAFYLGNKATTNLSEITINANYTQFNQLNIPLEADIWTKNNTYNLQSDFRYMIYPLETYGLGSKTTDSDATLMNFNYVRLYQSVLRNLGDNWYAGLGYNLDYYWNTTVESLPNNRVSDAENENLTPKSVSSGVTLNLLFDNRKNAINPQGGEQYANMTYRNNTTLLGSDNNWQSVIIDLRKYVTLSDSRHILAFWSYNALTLAGNPPYQALPSIGWDTYNNTGRGYVQGRFRGKDMVYLESEYRFPLTRNGLLSGVVFLNGESFTEPISNRFEAISAGGGAGLRFKLNKNSNTNISIDYGFGAHNSRGFFVNLGEIF